VARSPSAATQNFSFGRRRKIPLELVPFDAKRINLIQHSLQEGFGRRRRYSGPLQLADFTALPPYLGPHVLNLISDVVQSHSRLRITRGHLSLNVLFGSRVLAPSPFPSAVHGVVPAYRDAQLWNYPLQGLLVHEDGITS
jgi:hypothetical protein